MNKAVIFIFSAVVLTISFISCVSGKKYKALQDTSRQFMNERDAFKTDNIGLEMTTGNLRQKSHQSGKRSQQLSRIYQLPRVKATKQLRITIRSLQSMTNFKMHRKL